MSDSSQGTEGEAEGATGMVGEERRALESSQVDGDVGADHQGRQAGEETPSEDEIANRGERDLTSQ